MSSLDSLPADLLARVLEAIVCLEARAAACCVCESWSIEAAARWQHCAAEAGGACGVAAGSRGSAAHGLAVGRGLRLRAEAR
eukprot:2498160-Prymnesium_polylepis.1